MDVGIVIALKEEFDEFFEEIKDSNMPIPDKTGTYFYTFERPSADPSRPYQCVVTFAGQMGPTKAALLTQTLLNQWEPATVVNIGIAGAK